MFSESSQRQQFHELMIRQLDNKSTDSLTNKINKFFSPKTKLYYKKETKSYVLTHNNEEIAGFASREILEEFIKFYARYELQMHRIDVETQIFE